MKTGPPKFITILSLITIVFVPTLRLIPIVSAFDVASQYYVSDTQALSGDLVSYNPSKDAKTLVRSNVSYDNHLFGVITDNPLAVYKDINPNKSNRAVLREGDTVVNVTDYNGTIQPGDYITTSPIAGKGMKVVQSGYAIGVAISSVTPGTKITFQGRQVTTGQVNVALQIQYFELGASRSTLRAFEALDAAFFRNVSDPEKFTVTMRYLIAGLVAVIAFSFGFLAFSRSVARGVEAVGRNPLAKSAIQASMGMQIGLTLATTLAGIILAVIIIRL